MLCLAASIPQIQADVTILVRGTAPHIHVFNTDGTPPTDGSTGWPGIQMTNSTTSSDGTTWYYVNYEGLNSCSIVFNNGNSGNNNQTWDIDNVSGTNYYYSNGSNYYLNLTVAKDKAGYVFFEDTYNWGGTLRAHCWNDNYSTEWPGDIMTFVGGTNGGRNVYAWSNETSTPGMIIFTNKNGGTQQTGDLTYVNGRYYYNNGNSTNDDYSNLAFPTLPTAPVVPDYYVVGDDALIGYNWATNANSLMTESSGTYTWTKTGIHLNIGTYKLKVLDSNNTWYGGNDGGNVEVCANENGTYTLTVNFDPSTGIVTATLNRTATDATQAYNIYVRYTGSVDPSHVYLHTWNSAASYNEWPGTALSDLTTQTINGYTYYVYTINTTASSIGLLFNENGSSSTQTGDLSAQPGDNYFTYGGGSSVTGPSTEPDAMVNYYITGSEGLGLGWSHDNPTALTYNETTQLYSYTYNVEKDGTYNFIFANGTSDNWDTFNANYRIGPQSGNQAIALNNNWVGTQLAHTDGGSYQINCAAGQVTIYFNPATMQFKVDATAPTYQYTFYIYPSDGATTPHIYLWDNATPENIYTHAFPGNEVTATEVLADGRTWYKYSTTILVDVLNAIVSGGGSNADNTKTKNITNFEPGTYYIVWDPVRANGDEYNHFELYNNPPSAVGDHKLFIHGGYYHGGQTFSYTSNTGSELKYDGNTGNYYINNITLSSNATFCFTTLLGEDWQSVGTRYGNGGADGYTVNPTGSTNYLEVTDSRINTNMSMGVWSETYGEYKMFTAGVYNIIANPTQGWVKLIKTDHKNLSPMNVYLEQTGNVEIDNIMTPGTTYTTAMFSGYWPLSAYNQEQGGWDPNSDSQHYPVTYIGDTTTVDGKKWWHWQVSASIAEVFFTRTNKEPFQSETIHRRAGVMWYTWDEENGQTVMTDHTREYFEAAANALPSNAVVIEGHYYVYFINTLGWDRVFCYAWENGDGLYTDGYNRILENWPGHVCEPVGIDPVTGYEVWRYDLGTISSIEEAPDGILFNDGDPNALSDNKEQTGDFEYINGGVYDYLGLFDGAYTLNNLIRTAAKEVRYTVSNDLLAVYYDPNAVTTIEYQNEYGEDTSEDIKGALYAKDLNQYGEKSVMPNDDVTDYVYQTCGSNHTPGRSQIMIKKTTYDQSNWVKLVMSPNYDGGNPEPVDKNERPNLAQYVGHIIPAGTLDVFMTDTVNPTAHVLDIKMGETMSYEPNVYISAHFNDTVVFNYTHRDWQPKDENGNPAYKGNYRTKPVVTWNYTYDEQGNVSGVSGGTVTRERVVKEPYYMYYVAPKPQELAYITWVVYDNYNDPTQWQGYVHGEYHPYTSANGSDTPPSDPGRFYGPMNWDRSIQLTANDYNNMKNLSTTEIEEYLSQGAHSSDYGPYSNGYMQYGGIKVNWSLFDNEGNGGPWWQIFKPGQAYKFLAIIRYARGSGETNSGNNCCYQPSIGYYVKDQDTAPYQDRGTVFSAPRRDQEAPSGYINMYFSSYDDLDQSKFIIFPIKASASNSRGDEIGNVTEVKEVIAEVNVPRDIVSVNYYNLMGVESDKPFDGINIVVTTYSDGTRTSRKILR